MWHPCALQSAKAKTQSPQAESGTWDLAPLLASPASRPLSDWSAPCLCLSLIGVVMLIFSDLQPPFQSDGRSLPTEERKWKKKFMPSWSANAQSERNITGRQACLPMCEWRLHSVSLPGALQSLWIRELILWEDRPSSNDLACPLSRSPSATSFTTLTYERRKEGPKKNMHWKLSSNLIVLWMNTSLDPRKVNSILTTAQRSKLGTMKTALRCFSHRWRGWTFIWKKTLNNQQQGYFMCLLVGLGKKWNWSPCRD